MIYDYPGGKIFNKKGDVIEKALEYRGPKTYYVAFSNAEGVRLFAYEYKHNGGRRVFYDGRKIRPLSDDEIKNIILEDQEKVMKKNG